MGHGKAEARGREWPLDELRLLSQTGRQRTRHCAAGLRRLGVQPQRTLSSPLVRARQTAEIVHEVLKLEHPIEFVDSLAGWRLSRIVADESTADVGSVLLVGHEPTLSELIGLLVGGREASIRLRPGSIARLNAPELHPGPCAELEWLLTRKQLSAIGR